MKLPKKKEYNQQKAEHQILTIPIYEESTGGAAVSQEEGPSQIRLRKSICVIQAKKQLPSTR